MHSVYQHVVKRCSLSVLEHLYACNLCVNVENGKKIDMLVREEQRSNMTCFCVLVCILLLVAVNIGYFCNH
jgi:hypothetical protein